MAFEKKQVINVWCLMDHGNDAPIAFEQGPIRPSCGNFEPRIYSTVRKFRHRLDICASQTRLESLAQYYSAQLTGVGHIGGRRN